jgi:uncharacterized membrane protein YdjX (TVP38/TMEM64 family)
VSDRVRFALRAALALGGLAALLLLARQLHFLSWIAQGATLAREAGPLGAFGVYAAFIALTLLTLPMVPLTMACGWIYGMPGLAVAIPATTTSATIAFLIGRALGKTRVQKLLTTRPRLRAIAELAERNGLVTVALLRVSPILPFSPSNAVLGMTHLRLRDLVIGTTVGIVPGGVLYVSVGALLPDAAALERGELPARPFWVLLGFGVAALAVIGTAAARKLRSLSAKTPSTGA